jgi:hypothetical protein
MNDLCIQSDLFGALGDALLFLSSTRWEGSISFDDHTYYRFEQQLSQFKIVYN